jgi:16S rRNA (guanine966-N2)-methyltransferase
MTRIIGGSAKGRTLRVPGEGTRPTSDRVREAMFSSLEHRLGTFDGVCLYDLYAGSGAFALEALSRGAGRAVAVELDRGAAALMRANAAACGLSLEVVQSDVARFVERQPRPAPDLIFADPPYELPAFVLREQLATLLRQLPDHDVLVVVERSARDKASPLPDGCVDIDVRKHGETSVTYAHWYGYPHDGAAPA